MITYKGIEIKTNIKEFTVGEFEDVSAILNNESLEYVERYMDVLEKLGIPSHLMDEMTDEEFFDLISKFDMTCDLKLVPQFEHAGYTYIAHEGEFKLSIKALSLIEKAVASSPKKYLAKMIAIIFKRADMNPGEHYVETHLKNKERALQDLPATIAYPYLVTVIEKLNNKVKSGIPQELA